MKTWGTVARPELAFTAAKAEGEAPRSNSEYGMPASVRAALAFAQKRQPV